MREKIDLYLNRWSKQGYSDGIPDEVPDELMRLGLAPSYKAIAMAILKNDLTFSSLGFTGTTSAWYSELKRIELEDRGCIKQMRLL
jgi:predicted phosphoadenosine phosphosulfate sulfurtransferase